jgi:hypothetical protein
MDVEMDEGGLGHRECHRTTGLGPLIGAARDYGWAIASFARHSFVRGFVRVKERLDAERVARLAPVSDPPPSDLVWNRCVPLPP